MSAFTPDRIISGGQTGVDRAALDAAIELGIPCGGFVPRGRKAEDGPLEERYPMTECDSKEYPVRTEKNVSAANATLVLVRREPTGGTRLTIELCARHRKPCRVVRIAPPGPALVSIREFLEEVRPRVLNVAGPRESTEPGIQAQARDLLMECLR